MLQQSSGYLAQAVVGFLILSYTTLFRYREAMAGVLCVACIVVVIDIIGCFIEGITVGKDRITIEFSILE